MHWGVMHWSMMYRGVMYRAMMDRVMDRMMERRMTDAEVSLQAAVLSLALSKHQLVQAVAHCCCGLGSLVPGGLRGRVHGLRVHGAHRLHPLVPQDQAREANHHQ